MHKVSVSEALLVHCELFVISFPCRSSSFSHPGFPTKETDAPAEPSSPVPYPVCGTSSCRLHLLSMDTVTSPSCRGGVPLWRCTCGQYLGACLLFMPNLRSHAELRCGTLSNAFRRPQVWHEKQAGCLTRAALCGDKARFCHSSCCGLAWGEGLTTVPSCCFPDPWDLPCFGGIRPSYTRPLIRPNEVKEVASVTASAQSWLGPPSLIRAWGWQGGRFVPAQAICGDACTPLRLLAASTCASL
jgi:hypothetical protein